MEEARAAGEVLAAMITPAILISASGTLVLSTSNRLSRVVDRVRVLARDAEQLREPIEAGSSDPVLAAAKRSLIINQLRALSRRVLLLRSALAALYAAIGFLVASSLAVGALTTLSLVTRWPAIALALLGACTLLWGSVLLVREGLLAVGSTLQEMQHVRQVIAHIPGNGPSA